MTVYKHYTTQTQTVRKDDHKKNKGEQEYVMYVMTAVRREGTVYIQKLAPAYTVQGWTEISTDDI